MHFIYFPLAEESDREEAEVLSKILHAIENLTGRGSERFEFNSLFFSRHSEHPSTSRLTPVSCTKHEHKNNFMPAVLSVLYDINAVMTVVMRGTPVEMHEGNVRQADLYYREVEKVSDDYIFSKGTRFAVRKIYLQTSMCNPVTYRLMFFVCLWIFMQSILNHLEKCSYWNRDGNSWVKIVFLSKQPKAVVRLLSPGHRVPLGCMS